MYRKFKKVVLSLLVHVTPLNFFSRILRSEALVYKSYFFQRSPFYRNYSTLDSHTNTVISHTFAYSSRRRRKPWQGLLLLYKNETKLLLHFLDFASLIPSSETQGQLVGSIKYSWWKFTVRSRRAPGHLLLPNQFQKRLNCLLLIGQKKIFLANQRREAAGWLSCFLTRRSFPHRSP